MFVDIIREAAEDAKALGWVASDIFVDENVGVPVRMKCEFSNRADDSKITIDHYGNLHFDLNLAGSETCLNPKEIKFFANLSASAVEVLAD